jgi:hypothetical protein
MYPLKPYNDFKPKSNWNTFYYFKNVFDNQMITQLFMKDFECGEVTCPTKYFEEASSINFKRSLKYGIGCVFTAIQYRLHRWGIKNFKYLG